MFMQRAPKNLLVIRVLDAPYRTKECQTRYSPPLKKLTFSDKAPYIIISDKIIDPFLDDVLKKSKI